MGNDPYMNGMLQESPFFAKSDVEAALVLILQSRMEHRGLRLIPQPSRCVCQYQVHEFSFTDEEGAKPGAPVDRIGGIGFAEITRGGVILVGDQVFYNDVLIGTVAGFDETHMPNHYNILLRRDRLETGRDLNMVPGSRLRFHRPE